MKKKVLLSLLAVFLLTSISVYAQEESTLETTLEYVVAAVFLISSIITFLIARQYSEGRRFSMILAGISLIFLGVIPEIIELYGGNIILPWGDISSAFGAIILIWAMYKIYDSTPKFR